MSKQLETTGTVLKILQRKFFWGFYSMVSRTISSCILNIGTVIDGGELIDFL